MYEDEKITICEIYDLLKSAINLKNTQAYIKNDSGDLLEVHIAYIEYQHLQQPKLIFETKKIKH